MKRIALVPAILLVTLPLFAQQEAGNLKILTGLSKLQLQREMNVMRAGLGVHCDFCHVAPTKDNGNKWDFASDANENKETARSMIKMVADLNKSSFHGRPVITCYSCHNGHIRPLPAVPLPQAQPPFPTPVQDNKTFPAAKELLAKYVEAIGGEKALPLLHAKSFTASGTRIDTKGTSAPFDLRQDAGRIYVKVKTADADVEQMFGPDSGWAKDKTGVHDLRANDLDQAHDIYPAFDPFDPATMSEKARTIAKSKVGDRDAWLVAERLDDNTSVQVWFDPTTGLALRRLILVGSIVGRIPKQTDFADYRDAGGVKLPYEVTFSSVDPWIGSTRKYSEIHPGAPVDPAVFVKSGG